MSDSKLNTYSEQVFLSIPARLRALDGDEQPIWGLMSPRHMVEHLVGSWMISNGKAQVKCIFEGDELAERRKFLFSDVPYQRNITNPVQGDGLAKLRKADLASAIDQLESEIITFFEYHESNPQTMEVHPVFGVLDYEGWIVFQSKHMQHHLAQFNISLD
jgi:hypothetical protein